MLKTREQWLTEATDIFRDHLFKRNDYIIPKVRVSVGFPGGGSARKRIGECWDGSASTDGVEQVFISPVVIDVSKVLGVLVHELVHATVGTKAGHRGPFRRCALKVGLEGKMTVTSESQALKDYFTDKVTSVIGEYPHAELRLNGQRKKQTTRLKKVECQVCGYTVRVTQKWLDELGAPICPCNYNSDAELERME